MKWIIFLFLSPLSSHAKKCEQIPILKIKEPAKKSYDRISLLRVESYVKKHLKSLEEKEEVFKKDCPHCTFNSQTRFVFNAIPKKKITCGEKHIDKSYNFKREFKGKKNKKVCDKEGITNQVQSFVRDMVKGKSKDKEIHKLSSDLWAKCPEKCSYSVDQSTHFNEKDCKADLNLNIKCVNKALGGLVGNNKFKANMKYQSFKCQKGLEI